MNIGPSDPIDHTDITQGSDLSGMDLTGIDLTSADLSEAYLSNVILAGADLSEVCFVNTHLTGADLTDTTLANADLSNATLTGADLSNADLSGADLSDADLINTDLTNATLRGVDLSNATFAGADLTGVDLRGTALTDNEIRGANQSEAQKDTTTTTTADTTGPDASLSDLSQWESAHQKNSDELLTILQSLHDRLNRIPKPSELPEDSKYSPREFYTEFGSWDEALEAAGIDKEQAILDEIERLTEELGRVPNIIDLESHDAYPASDYNSCFDSWDEAIEESEIEMNGSSVIPTASSSSSENDREHSLSPRITGSESDLIETEAFRRTCEYLVERILAGHVNSNNLESAKSNACSQYGSPGIPENKDIINHASAANRDYVRITIDTTNTKSTNVEKSSAEESASSTGDLKREEMLNTVKSLHNNLDRVPKSTELPEEYSPNDFYARFGSWNEALEAAGFNIKQEILDEIKRVSDRVEHVPTTTDIDKHSEYPASNYNSYFDSWDDALRQSGVKKRFEKKSAESREEMLNAIQSLQDQLGRIPKSNELPEEYSPYDFYTEFGSWDEALEAAGIDKKQAVLNEIERVAEEIGRIPATGDIHRYGEYPASDYGSYFDSWNEALEQSRAQKKLEMKSEESRKDILNALQSLHDRLGRAPKTAETPEGYSLNDFYTEFGSWDEALEAAGIDKKQALLDDLKQVAIKIDHVPKTSDIDEHGVYSYSTYSSYFDSWHEALKESKIKERFGQTREEMLNTLQSLQSRLGRVPKSTELPEEYSQYDFYTEFGSWNEALEAAGFDMEQEILDEIERVADKVEYVPGAAEVAKHGEYPVSNYDSYFDSLDKAVKESGVEQKIERKSERSHSREEMINKLRLLHDQLGRVPKSTELPDKYSPNDFYTEFGSWDEALTAAGFDIEQKILDEIERVAGKVESMPTTTDINEHSGYPASAYQSYFDSWDDALRQSEVETNKLTDDSEGSFDSFKNLGKSPSPDEIERLFEIRGVGRPTARRILETFGTVDEAASASTHELTEIRGVGEATAARITSMTRQTDTDQGQSNSEKRSTTTGDSEMSSEDGDIDSVKILDEIADEFEEL